MEPISEKAPGCVVALSLSRSSPGVPSALLFVALTRFWLPLSLKSWNKMAWLTQISSTMPETLGASPSSPTLQGIHHCEGRSGPQHVRETFTRRGAASFLTTPHMVPHTHTHKEYSALPTQPDTRSRGLLTLVLTKLL